MATRFGLKRLDESGLYSTIAWIASAHKGIQPDVHYGPKSSTTTGMVFDFLSALGNIAFA
ncbi:hypothetical protein Sjap_023365 [Stephania japonica]|uniref:Uncharacterized protein n=1 Tax=Stephania japonica TaxID=461633 RepID=A0AAP0EIQ5_9MAGN